MAELVDALVSKTNEVTLVPVRSRLRVRSLRGCRKKDILFCLCQILKKNQLILQIEEIELHEKL
jgi:hypothetical protein